MTKFTRNGGIFPVPQRRADATRPERDEGAPRTRHLRDSHAAVVRPGRDSFAPGKRRGRGAWMGSDERGIESTMQRAAPARHRCSKQAKSYIASCRRYDRIALPLMAFIPICHPRLVPGSTLPRASRWSLERFAKLRSGPRRKAGVIIRESGGYRPTRGRPRLCVFSLYETCFALFARRNGRRGIYIARDRRRL